ncbi:MAG: DNA replication/repair protein RecF [Oscillospiraceae bacterium]|nr:DNA replication/repair protein RecF [Oscillospiraceae bacterium]
MRVTSFYAAGFRNFDEIRIQPEDGINIIFGRNGQGKTNLLEGISLFSGMRSFRRAKNPEMIQKAKDFARLSMDFISEDRDQSAEILITPEKRACELNRVKQPAASELIGKFCTVVFSPDTMALVSGGASERRRFLDAAISQSFPRFMYKCVEYQRVLSQRNALVKRRNYSPMLEVWDERLAQIGAEISYKRAEYTERLRPLAGETYGRISGSREPLDIRFRCGYSRNEPDAEDYKTDFLQTLEHNRESDLRVGFTQNGAQRDDVEVMINGFPARQFGSQGQKRSAVLALKLAEASLLGETIESRPVALLDDVMSELDSSRQEFLLGSLSGWQVFLTCCEPGALKLLDKGRVFEIENGKLV